MLEELKEGAAIWGILPSALATVVNVRWFGADAIELTYKEPGGELLYRDRQPTLEVALAGRPWGFDGDGERFHLVSKANRIRRRAASTRCLPSTPRWSNRFR